MLESDFLRCASSTSSEQSKALLSEFHERCRNTGVRQRMYILGSVQIFWNRGIFYRLCRLKMTWLDLEADDSYPLMNSSKTRRAHNNSGYS